MDDDRRNVEVFPPPSHTMDLATPNFSPQSPNSGPVTPLFTLDETKRILARTYKGISGYLLGEEEKQHQQDITAVGNSSYTYGEILPDSLSHFAHEFGVNPDSIFMDIGAGVGKAVLQMALEFGVRRSFGLEISKDRFTGSKQAMARLAEKEGITLETVDFWLGDASESRYYPYGGIDFVYMNIFAFPKPTVQTITHHLEEMVVRSKRTVHVLSVGSHDLPFSKALPPQATARVSVEDTATTIQTTWGPAAGHAYRVSPYSKKKPPVGKNHPPPPRSSERELDECLLNNKR